MGLSKDKDKSFLKTPTFHRGQAEEQLWMKTAEKPPPRTEEDMLRLVHELEVHQIELEMQNEELRRAKDELELSRDKYAELYDFAPVGYFSFDPQGLIREANLTAAQMLGIERSALAGKPFISFIADATSRAVFSNHLKSVSQKQVMETCEVKLAGKYKEVVQVQLQSVRLGAVASHSGFILSSIVVGTAGKHWETEIQDAREYAENIVETVRESLLVLNPALKILTANRKFYETFQVTPEETIGNFIYDLGNRQWNIPKLQVLLENILPNHTVFNDYEVDHVFPDIGHKVILLNARQIFRKSVGSHIILLAMEDITDRKAAENVLSERRQELEFFNILLELRIKQAVDDLRKSDQENMHDRIVAMGEMINNIAHQWRQPLNTLGLVIQQFKHSFDNGECTEASVGESTTLAMMTIKQMSQTINDFRNFFRSDKEKCDFCVVQGIRNVVYLIEKTFRDQGISIVFKTEGGPRITGYPNEYAQVLLNILTNARDALVENQTENAVISIHAFIDGDKAVVTIADNAGGISAEVLGRLFDPYFTTKGPDKGTGVGLFMSKTIIERNMGGRLLVCNTEVGAEFRIEV
jgi:signal transduction histidine kinase